MGKKNRPRSQQPIGGLADALLKAGLTDEKSANRAKVERRQERKSLGSDGIARRQADREADRKAAHDAEVAAARAREMAREGQVGVDRIKLAIKQHTDPSRGSKRWYYVARDGRVPFLEVSDGALRLLSDGRAAIVESLSTSTDSHVVVSDAQALALIHEHDPELIRFWNRPGAP